MMCMGESQGQGRREEGDDADHDKFAAWERETGEPEVPSDDDDLSGGGYMPVQRDYCDAEEEEEAELDTPATPQQQEQRQQQAPPPRYADPHAAPKSPSTPNGVSVSQLLRSSSGAPSSLPRRIDDTPPPAAPEVPAAPTPVSEAAPAEPCPVLRFPAKKIMERMQQRELERARELQEKEREAMPHQQQQQQQQLGRREEEGQRGPRGGGAPKGDGWRVSGTAAPGQGGGVQSRTVSAPVPSSEIRTPAMRRRHQLQYAEHEAREREAGGGAGGAGGATPNTHLFSYKPISKKTRANSAAAAQQQQAKPPTEQPPADAAAGATEAEQAGGAPPRNNGERFQPPSPNGNSGGYPFSGSSLPASVKALRMAEREARELERERRGSDIPPGPPPARLPREKLSRSRKRSVDPQRDGREAATPAKKGARDTKDASSPTREDAEDAAPASPTKDEGGETQQPTPSKVPSRHRDLLANLRKKRGKTKDRVKVYVNASAAKMVVLNAMNTCRFEFAPLRDGANLLWLDRGISVEAAKALVDEKQRINRFPGMKDLCNKVLFTRHLNRMAALFPEDFEFYPQTYCLPGDEEDLHQLIASNAALKRKNKKKIDSSRPIWICKPSRGRQGTGIFLTQDLSDVVGERGVPFNCDVEYVVQQYIEKPLLIDGLKFDLRLYVVVFGVDPLRVYIYDEGLARFATNKYQPLESHSMRDAYMHLTNYSLNKDSDNFVPNTDASNEDTGSKRSIKSVRKWLESEGHDSEKVWADIHRLVNNTMLALQPSLQLNVEAISKPGDDNFKCFQILGFDVMFDSNLKPWLLEINAGPSLEASSPLDQAVKEPLVVSALRLGTFGLLPRVRPSLRKAFEAGHFGALTQIFPSVTSHLHGHLVLFNKELRSCFEAACGLKGEMTATRFCKFFREAGVIRSFKQLGHDSRKTAIRVDDVPTSVSEKPPVYSTNKAFELRKRMQEGKKGGDDNAAADDDTYTTPDGYEPLYGLKQFNIDIPTHLVDKVRTLTQPELELLFLKKLKMREGSTGLSFFEFINIVVEMAMHSYKAKEFDHYTLLQKLRLFIPSKKDDSKRNSSAHGTPQSGNRPPQNLKELLTAKPM